MICQLKCGEDKEEEDHSRNREEYVQRAWDKEKIKNKNRIIKKLKGDSNS